MHPKLYMQECRVFPIHWNQCFLHAFVKNPISRKCLLDSGPITSNAAFRQSSNLQYPTSTERVVALLDSAKTSLRKDFASSEKVVLVIVDESLLHRENLRVGFRREVFRNCRGT
jgi:hypothetical protein